MKKHLLLLIVPSFISMLFINCEKDTLENDLNKIELNVTTITKLPSELEETSGLIVSNSNIFWSHGDSGNPNKLYQFDSTGSILKSLTISNVKNNDWEDLAIDDLGQVYINDAGNNSNRRTDLAIYRIPNPDAIRGNTVEAEIISFRLEDQSDYHPAKSERNFNIKAIIWKNDSIFLFAKDDSSPFTGIAKMYSIPAIAGNHIAKLKAKYFVVDKRSNARITGADINLETSELVLLTQNQILSFTNYPNNNFFEGEVNEYRFDKDLGQIEGIGFLDNDHLYITNEEGKKKNKLYKVKLPPR